MFLASSYDFEKKIHPAMRFISSPILGGQDPYFTGITALPPLTSMFPWRSVRSYANQSRKEEYGIHGTMIINCVYGKYRVDDYFCAPG